MRALSFLSKRLGLGWLAVMLLLSGCQTLPPGRDISGRFPEPGAGWHNEVGQLRYVTPERAVIGEVVVSRKAASDFQLDFLTGPGVPLMRLRLSGVDAYAEGLFARGHWEGNPARAGRLSGWFALREVFAAAKEGTFRSAPRARLQWSAEAEDAAGRLERLSVEFPKTRERFVFVFAR